MKITIIAVGKIKESFYRDAVREFEKRLKRYCTLKIIEVTDEKTPDQATEGEELQIKRKEGERVMARISQDSYVTALAIEGRKMTSEKLAGTMSDLFVRGKSNLVFVIGGSLGLDEQVLKRADLLLSFSDMTFPHQLMRVILLEQIYRSFRIMKGEPYHK